MKGLARLSSQSLGLKIIRFVLGIGSAALLTRLMPIHDYGIYAYTLVIAALLAIPGEAGMPNLVMREIARARVDENLPRIRGIVRFANLTVLSLTLIMAGMTGIVLWAAYDRISPALHWSLVIVFPAILFGALANTRAGIQRGLGSPIASQLPEQIIRPGAIIVFALLGWAIVGHRFDAVTGIIGFVLASATAFVTGTVLLYRTYQAKVGPGPAESRTRAWLIALAPFSAIAGLQVAVVQVSAFMLGLTAPATEMATFRIATLGSDFAMFSTFAISTLVTPQFAELLHRGEKAKLQELIGRVNRMNVLFAGAVLTGIVVVAPWGLKFVFGKAYGVSYLPMCILAAGHLLGVSMGYVTTLANMAGREKATMIAAVFGLTLNASLSAFLSSRYGAIGAASATAITVVTWRLVLAIAMYRVLDIRAWAFSRTIPNAVKRFLP